VHQGIGAEVCLGAAPYDGVTGAVALIARDALQGVEIQLLAAADDCLQLLGAEELQRRPVAELPARNKATRKPDALSPSQLATQSQHSPQQVSRPSPEARQTPFPDAPAILEEVKACTAHEQLARAQDNVRAQHAAFAPPRDENRTRTILKPRWKASNCLDIEPSSRCRE
jgi:hypothetical protein